MINTENLDIAANPRLPISLDDVPTSTRPEQTMHVRKRKRPFDGRGILQQEEDRRDGAE